MANQAVSTVFKALEDKNRDSRELALYEIKNLRKDLNVLEKIVSGKQKKLSVTPHDIVHEALEIFRHVSSILENETLATGMEESLGQAEAHEFLASHGATLLKKPSGWHWFSPDGEMHFLGKAIEPDKAAQKLETLVAGRKKGKAKKAPAKAAAPAPAPAKGAEG